MRNLINLLPKVVEPYHYVRLTRAAKSDVSWWLVGVDKFHGSTPFKPDIPEPNFAFATDACMVGGAGHWGADWFYVSWNADYPELADANINVLELQSVLVAVRRWGPLWAGKHICVRSDNAATIAAINNTTSRSPALLLIIKELFWLTVEHNFRLSAIHLPGKLNVMSDKLSRLHVREEACNAIELLTGSSNNIVCCRGKMSKTAYMSLQESWAWSY
jgi:hypothetical protein